ncbi:MAG: hypothetical protein PF961_09820, partial [Planctomycetota bacterium]|nr:hypothetical protein [Planctomycetota bacterium]
VGGLDQGLQARRGPYHALRRRNAEANGTLPWPKRTHHGSRWTLKPFLFQKMRRSRRIRL